MPTMMTSVGTSVMTLPTEPGDDRFMSFTPPGGGPDAPDSATIRAALDAAHD
jgi:hypothetical protein